MKPNQASTLFIILTLLNIARTTTHNKVHFLSLTYLKGIFTLINKRQVNTYKCKRTLIYQGSKSGLLYRCTPAAAPHEEATTPEIFHVHKIGSRFRNCSGVMPAYCLNNRLKWARCLKPRRKHTSVTVSSGCMRNKILASLIRLL